MPVVSARAWVSQWMHPVKVLWSIKVSAYLPHMAGFDAACPERQSPERSPGCICAPSVWRRLLLTFFLYYSVELLGLWFCLKAPVHRREAWGGESLFLSFSSSHFIFFFFFSLCNMFTFAVAWDFFTLVECIERLYPLFKDFLGQPFEVLLD